MSEQEQAPQTSPNNYDQLLDPSADLSHLSVDGARVESPSEPTLTKQEEDARDAALRARNPQPPLTPEQIARLAAHRGQPVTPEQIEGMNGARAAGIHTSIV
jgi:hypothetical protein